MTLKKKIEKYLNQFETKERGEKTITVFKDESEELKNSVYKAHGDRLPNDWIFDKYESILSTLSGYEINNEDDLNNNRPEIVDSLVDIYTNNLTEWLADNNHNVYYLE